MTEWLHFHKEAGHCRLGALSLGGRTVSTLVWQFASLSWLALTSGTHWAWVDGMRVLLNFVCNHRSIEFLTNDWMCPGNLGGKMSLIDCHEECLRTALNNGGKHWLQGLQCLFCLLTVFFGRVTTSFWCWGCRSLRLCMLCVWTHCVKSSAKSYRDQTPARPYQCVSGIL